MKIRPYTSSDFEQILQIYAHGKLDELVFELNNFTLIPLNQDEKRFKAFRQSSVFVYEEENIAGYVAINESEISSLFVHPNQRGKSIGGKLLEYAINHGPHPMTLQVVTSNTPAKNLYLKQGFKKKDSFLAQYNGVDVWVDKMVFHTR